MSSGRHGQSLSAGHGASPRVDAASGPRRPRPTLLELTIGFAQLGLRGFGGVAGHARQVVVVERRWLDDAEFAELLGLGQALPGANVTNLAAIVGDRSAGPLGAVLAVGAITLPSTVIAVTVAGAAVAIAGHAPRFLAGERAVSSAAAGLVIATGVRAFRAAAITKHRTCAPENCARLALVALIVVLVAVLGLTLPVVVPLALALSMAIEWSARRAERGAGVDAAHEGDPG